MLRAAIVLAILAAQAAPSPFQGEWIVNAAKSKTHPDYKFHSVTLEFDVATDRVTISSRVAQAAGDRPQRVGETFRTDGTFTPGTLSQGVMLAAKWNGPNVLETIATKDGKELATISYEVSRDGKSLIARSTGAMAQMLVFERK